ncbi:MAG: hypothetical protein RIC55_02925 [Pirellulaceae bacterium]
MINLLMLVAAAAWVTVAVVLGARLRSWSVAVRLALAGPLTCLAAGLLLIHWPPLKPTFPLTGGTVLEYQVEPLWPGQKIDMTAVAEEASYLTWTFGDGVRSEATGGNRFVVKVPKSAESRLRDIEGAVQGASGEVLALRIVALPGVDDFLLERSGLDDGPIDPEKPIIVEELGVVAASWAPYKEGVFDLEGDPRHEPRAFLRTHEGERYVLLLHSPNDVTGRDIAGVVSDVDEAMRPTVNFTTTSEGAERMAQLSSQNLPSQDGARRLAVVVDGVVATAPNIQSIITTRGRITGNFTRQEVEDMVTMLSLGSFGASVSLVQRRQTAADAGTMREILVHLAVIVVVWLLIAAAMTVLNRPAGLAITAGSLMQVVVMLGLAAIFDAPLSGVACRAAALAVLFPLGCLLITPARIRARKRDGQSLAEAIRGGCRGTRWATLSAYLLVVGVGAAMLIFGDLDMRHGGGVMLVGGLAGLFARFTLAAALLELFGILSTGDGVPTVSKPTASPS